MSHLAPRRSCLSKTLSLADLFVVDDAGGVGDKVPLEADSLGRVAHGRVALPAAVGDAVAAVVVVVCGARERFDKHKILSDMESEYMSMQNGNMRMANGPA